MNMHGHDSYPEPSESASAATMAKNTLLLMSFLIMEAPIEVSCIMQNNGLKAPIDIKGNYDYLVTELESQAHSLQLSSAHSLLRTKSQLVDKLNELTAQWPLFNAGKTMLDWKESWPQEVSQALGQIHDDDPDSHFDGIPKSFFETTVTNAAIQGTYRNSRAEVYDYDDRGSWVTFLREMGHWTLAMADIGMNTEESDVKDQPLITAIHFDPDKGIKVRLYSTDPKTEGFAPAASSAILAAEAKKGLPFNVRLLNDRTLVGADPGLNRVIELAAN